MKKHKKTRLDHRRHKPRSVSHRVALFLKPESDAEWMENSSVSSLIWHHAKFETKENELSRQKGN